MLFLRITRPMTAVSRPRYGGAAKFTSSAVARQQVAAVVVGGGAGGIAVLGNLLANTSHGKIAWVDPLFQGGRINRKYREVPSNTKVALFLEYAKGTKSLEDIMLTTPSPNAATALQNLKQDETCSLAYAGDLLQLLSDGLLKHERVEVWQGKVNEANWSETNAEWSLAIEDTESQQIEKRTAPLVVYCTGASPTTVALPTSSAQTPELLDLDTALTPSILALTLAKHKEVTVGVIGASHSAVLILMNLLKLAQSTHPLLRVRWFARSPNLKYAIYKEGWILYDNTGLKGEAAKFARAQLDGDTLQTSDAGKVITRVNCFDGPAQEKEAMLRELPGCDYVVQAVGFTKDELPAMNQDIAFNHETGGFADPKTGRVVPGLFGAGIAFPERVVDPAGNVEYAVGFFKFMRFLKKVVPQWVAKTYAPETKDRASL